MTIRFLTSGESHGMCLNAIIDGIGYGYHLDVDFINSELANRQKGKGRGGRMKIETDTVEIKSGARFGVTTGAPLCIEIKNKDFDNWRIVMCTDKVQFDEYGKVEENEILEKIKDKRIVCPRPGHADYAGHIKYGAKDIRDILERSSARETATRVAVGAICQNILKNFGIEGKTKVLSIGGKENENETDEIIALAKEEGVSLGGVIQIEFRGLPVGLGSYVQWDRRLDGQLAQALMSIPAVKSVEVGLGKKSADMTGNKVHDEMILKEGKIEHLSNNAGGIEGGMTNGEPVILTIGMKPIPTMRKKLKSYDIDTMQEKEAHFERADVCAVEACGVVAKNMCAIVLLNAFMDKFGGDSYLETLKNYENR